MLTNAFHRDSGPGDPARVLLSPCTGAGMLHAGRGREELRESPEREDPASQEVSRIQCRSHGTVLLGAN